LLIDWVTGIRGDPIDGAWKPERACHILRKGLGLDSRLKTDGGIPIMEGVRGLSVILSLPASATGG